MAQPSELTNFSKESTMNLKVAIAGASGYVGGELARILEHHPNVELVTVTGNSSVGETLGSLNVGLQKYAFWNCDYGTYRTGFKKKSLLLKRCLFRIFNSSIQGP